MKGDSVRKCTKRSKRTIDRNGAPLKVQNITLAKIFPMNDSCKITLPKKRCREEGKSDVLRRVKPICIMDTFLKFERKIFNLIKKSISNNLTVDKLYFKIATEFNCRSEGFFPDIDMLNDEDKDKVISLIKTLENLVRESGEYPKRKEFVLYLLREDFQDPYIVAFNIVLFDLASVRRSPINHCQLFKHPMCCSEILHSERANHKLIYQINEHGTDCKGIDFIDEFFNFMRNILAYGINQSVLDQFLVVISKAYSDLNYNCIHVLGNKCNRCIFSQKVYDKLKIINEEDKITTENPKPNSKIELGNSSPNIKKYSQAEDSGNFPNEAMNINKKPNPSSDPEKVCSFVKSQDTDEELGCQVKDYRPILVPALPNSPQRSNSEASEASEIHNISNQDPALDPNPLDQSLCFSLYLQSSSESIHSGQGIEETKKNNAVESEVRDIAKGPGSDNFITFDNSIASGFLFLSELL